MLEASIFTVLASLREKNKDNVEQRRLKIYQEAFQAYFQNAFRQIPRQVCAIFQI